MSGSNTRTAPRALGMFVVCLMIAAVGLPIPFSGALPAAAEAAGAPIGFMADRRNIGISVTPAVVERELGRFLWYYETQVAEMTVSNTGDDRLAVEVQVTEIARGDREKVHTATTAAGTGSALDPAMAIKVTPNRFVLSPGAASKVKVSVDRKVTGVDGPGGLCAALSFTGMPVNAEAGGSAFAAGCCIAVPVMIRFSGKTATRVSTISISTTDLPGACVSGAAPCVEPPGISAAVKNYGDAYARVDAAVMIRTQLSRKTIRIPLGSGVILPGQERTYSASLADRGIAPGRYLATLQVWADGKQLPASEFTIEISGTGRASVLDFKPTPQPRL